MIEVVSIDDHYIYFRCERHIGTKLGAVYVKSKRCYKLLLGVHTLLDLYKLADSDHDRELIKKYGTEIKNYSDTLLLLKEQEDVPGDERLRPYQRVDVAFLKKAPHKGVFNQQRTGKTPTTLVAANEEGHNKIIIVCPASLKVNWQNEVTRWIDRSSIVIRGTPKKREKLYLEFKLAEKEIMIISYETLRQDIDKLSDIGYDCIIVDEAHRLRNYQTKQSKALYIIGKNAKSRYALSGTPAVNHASDIFGILRFLYPKKFTSFWNFAERYFIVREGQFTMKEIVGIRREHELQSMLATISTQRKRKDIMSWIPEKQVENIQLEFDPVQFKKYKEMLETYQVDHVDAANDLTKILRLRQICLDPALLGLQGKSPKKEFIMEYLKDNPEERIIIFSMFTSFLKELEKDLIKKGYSPVTIYGDMTNEDKQKSVDSIQAGSKRILLSNITSGKEGFTIDNADTIIFTDKDFAPVNNEQASDRFIPTTEVRALGKNLKVINLTIKDSVDDNINQILERKQSVIKFINDYGFRYILNLEKEDDLNARKSETREA